jgi:hypothetical protein
VRAAARTLPRHERITRIMSSERALMRSEVRGEVAPCGERLRRRADCNSMLGERETPGATPSLERNNKDSPNSVSSWSFN